MAPNDKRLGDKKTRAHSLTFLTFSSTHLVASSCDLWAPPGFAASALDAVVLRLFLLSNMIRN